MTIKQLYDKKERLLFMLEMIDHNSHKLDGYKRLREYINEQYAEAKHRLIEAVEECNRYYSELCNKVEPVNHGLNVELWRFNRLNSESKRAFANILRKHNDLIIDDISIRILHEVFGDIFSPDDPRVLKDIDIRTADGMAIWLDISADNEDSARENLPGNIKVINELVIPFKYLRRHDLEDGIEIEIKKVIRAFRSSDNGFNGWNYERGGDIRTWLQNKNSTV